LFDVGKDKSRQGRTQNVQFWSGKVRRSQRIDKQVHNADEYHSAVNTAPAVTST
jgi:hypothetical protein